MFTTEIKEIASGNTRYFSWHGLPARDFPRSTGHLAREEMKRKGIENQWMQFAKVISVLHSRDSLFF